MPNERNSGSQYTGSRTSCNCPLCVAIREGGNSPQAQADRPNPVMHSDDISVAAAPPSWVSEDLARYRSMVACRPFSPFGGSIDFGSMWNALSPETWIDYTVSGSDLVAGQNVWDILARACQEHRISPTRVEEIPAPERVRRFRIYGTPVLTLGAVDTRALQSPPPPPPEPSMVNGCVEQVPQHGTRSVPDPWYFRGTCECGGRVETPASREYRYQRCTDACRTKRANLVACPTCGGNQVAPRRGNRNGVCGDCWGTGHTVCAVCGEREASRSHPAGSDFLCAECAAEGAECHSS